MGAWREAGFVDKGWRVSGPGFTSENNERAKTMDGMKNLFDYAVKELEQDAFLMWLFESWKDPKNNSIVQHLLEAFCGLNKTDGIKDISTQAQWRNSDVRVNITLSDDRQIILLIEDKTFSSEHGDQLMRYNKAVEELEGEKHKIYYKTYTIDDAESERVKRAGWDEYDLKKIYDLFKDFREKDVFLVKQYIDHLEDLIKVNRNEVKPQSSETRRDVLLWDAYFKNTVISKLKDKLNEKGCNAWAFHVHYGYSLLKVEPQNDKDKLPYLEVRSRDCIGTNFRALILCYDIEGESILKRIVSQATKAANETDFWSTKNQRHKAGKEPKQICFFKKPLETESDEEFIARIEECIDRYCELLEKMREFSD